MRAGALLIAPLVMGCASLFGATFDGTLGDPFGDGGDGRAGQTPSDAGEKSPVDGERAEDAAAHDGDEEGTRRPVDGASPADGDAPAARTVTAVACGAYFTCAIADGDVWCFGNNDSAQLGNGRQGDGGATPTKVLLPGPATLLSATQFSSCALVQGDIYCWGVNGSGQLGSGSKTPLNVSVPSRVVGLQGHVEGVSAGNAHTCAVVDGAVYCWGYGRLGQIGDGTENDALTPKKVIPSGATAVSAAGAHTCALVSGRIQCWGLNNGALGDGSEGNKSVPTDVHRGGPGAEMVSAASDATCGIIHGAVSCWGEADDGNLGVSGADPLLEPNLLPALASDVTGIAANHGGCAVRGGGLWCWGAYPGEGSATSAVPVAVGGDLASGVTAAAVGLHQRCAVRGARLYCWGLNPSGEVGIPSEQTPNGIVPTPTWVPL